MDRQTWMYKISQASVAYIRGVEEFISCALENQKKQRERGVAYIRGVEEFISCALENQKKQRERGERDMISCPCRQCYNFKMSTSTEKLRDHLFRYGFKDGYTTWIWHGEKLHSNRNPIRKCESEKDSMTNKAGKSQKLNKHPLSPEKGEYAAKRSKRVDDPIASLSLSESSDSSTTSDARTGCGYSWVQEQGSV